MLTTASSLARGSTPASGHVIELWLPATPIYTASTHTPTEPEACTVLVTMFHHLHIPTGYPSRNMCLVKHSS